MFENQQQGIFFRLGFGDALIQIEVAGLRGEQQIELSLQLGAFFCRWRFTVRQ